MVGITAAARSKLPAAMYRGTGRRKSSVARVIIRKGTGKFVVNDKPMQEYFGGRALVHHMAKAPLKALDVESQFDVVVSVFGGGYVGQASAISLGIARALVQYDETGIPADYTPAEGEAVADSTRRKLRKVKMLTRDSRRVERKKCGLRKARKKEQYSKR